MSFKMLTFLEVLISEKFFMCPSFNPGGWQHILLLLRALESSHWFKWFRKRLVVRTTEPVLPSRTDRRNSLKACKNGGRREFLLYAWDVGCWIEGVMWQKGFVGALLWGIRVTALWVIWSFPAWSLRLLRLCHPTTQWISKHTPSISVVSVLKDRYYVLL